jgi:MFS family permease
MNAMQSLFCVAMLLYWFSMYTYVPILPLYAASLGASYKLVGLVIGVYGITQLLLRIPQGILSDRWRKRKLFVLLAMTVSCASALGMWLAPNVAWLVFFRSLSGVSATAWVVMVVLFSSYFSEAEAPRAYGIMNSLGFAGQMAGMFAGGLVAEWHGWSATFILAAAGAALGFCFSLGIKETTPTAAAPLRLAEAPAIMRNLQLLMAAVMASLAQLIAYGGVFGFVPVAAKNLGASNFELGLLPTLSSAPSIVASVLAGGWFVRRVGLRRSICLGFLLMGAATAVIPALDSLLQLYVSQMIGGFGRGLVFPLLMSFSVATMAPGAKATAMGVFQSLYALGMFAGPVVVGVMADTAGLGAGFWLCGVAGLLGLLIAWRFVGANH